MSRIINHKYTALAIESIDMFHIDIVQEVQKTVEEKDVVVVGMFLNPYVLWVRKTLSDHNIKYTYLGYGGYFTKWKQRLAIKMWSGWPTFPQVFVKGQLIGGSKKTRQALDDGTFHQLLN